MKSLVGKCHMAKDERGILFANDFDSLPFTPKRVVFVRFSEEKRPRGDHAYKYQQIILCLKGSVSIYLKSSQEDTDFYELKQGDWLWVEPGIWVIMSGHCDCSMAAIYSSKGYDATDYETDWNRYTTGL